MNKLNTRSEQNLVGVKEPLVRVVRRASEICSVPMLVIEGVRSKQRQAELFAKKATRTMDSRHLTGDAVDIVPYKVIGDKTHIDWNDKKGFLAVKDAMFAAAKELGVRIRWGGDWNMNGRSEDERFYDGPHFELPRA